VRHVGAGVKIVVKAPAGPVLVEFVARLDVGVAMTKGSGHSISSPPSSCFTLPTWKTNVQCSPTYSSPSQALAIRFTVPRV
jgi:hypothetical protein